MRIFITGGQGQLGRALRAQLEGAHIVQWGDLPDWNMTNPAHIDFVFTEFQPQVVIHAAALTHVDYCAQNPHEALRVNAFGTQNVAMACRRYGALMVAVSTNEVFDGAGSTTYKEYDQPNPVNPYGYSKYVGEQMVERFADNYLIVRTAWLFSVGGENFLHKVIARAREGQPLKIVTDEISSPTYAPDLAAAIAELIEVNRPGIYHMVNEGKCSRYELAAEILDLAGFWNAKIESIKLADFNRPSQVPPYTPLENMAGRTMGIELRDWRDALAEFVQRAALSAEDA